MSQVLFDSQGREIKLGAKIASAGEGTISDVADTRSLVAKIYHQPNKEKAEKLRAMAQIGNSRLVGLAAWPVDTLHKQRGGDLIGFLMPKVANAEVIHVLYGPKTRKDRFPQAGWNFLIHTAGNTARAFAAIHANGHVVGDVNHGNLLVSGQATVTLIDCDSFQINTNGRKFLCEVGVPTHTPAELQGVSFSKIVRNPNHDAFGLAVLIFQLLFMGRHPFAGAYLGAGDMPIEKAISEFRFAYGDNAKHRQMRQPQGTLSLYSASQEVALLFERAFSREGTNPNGRPSPQEWINALESLKKRIRLCQSNQAHHYFQNLTACPWCDIESKMGVLLFILPTPTTDRRSEQSAIELVERLWKQIVSVIPPAPAPRLPDTSSLSISLRYEVAVLADKRRNWWFAITNALRIGRARQEAQARKDAAQSEWQVLEEKWYRDEGYIQFQSQLLRLTELKNRHDGLPALRNEKLKRLVSEQEKRQRERFLDSFAVRTGAVSGIGPTKVATLQSYGISTALDVTENRVLDVPGFGPSLTYRLLTWRRDIENRFKFDAKLGIDTRDIAVIESEIVTARTQVINELRGGPLLLRQIITQMEMRRELLRPAVKSVLQTLAQAEADVQALS